MPALLQTRLKIAPDAMSQDIGGEVIIFFQDRYFSLVNVGARVWAWIAEHAGLDGLFAALLDEFEIDEATLRQDVGILLDQMIAEGLIIKDA